MTSDALPQNSFFRRLFRKSSRRSAQPPITVDFACANRIVKHAALCVMPLGQTLSVDEETCLRRAIEGAKLSECFSLTGLATIWSMSEYQCVRDFAHLVKCRHRIGATPSPDDTIGEEILLGREFLKARRSIPEKFAEAGDEFMAVFSPDWEFLGSWSRYIFYVLSVLTMAWILIIGIPFLHAFLATPSPGEGIGAQLTRASAEALSRYRYFSHYEVIQVSYILCLLATVFTYPLLRILKLR